MKIFLYPIFVLSMFSASAQLAGNDEKQLRELIVKLDNALVARDYEILNASYSDQMKLIAPNGFVLTKEMILEPFKDVSRTSALRKVVQEDVSIKLYQNSAYVTMRTIHSFSSSEDRIYENLHIYVKREGNWKLEVVMSNLI